MSFDAAWLDLREAADHAARDAGLLSRARGHLGNGLAVDLGCGTGSTARAFGAGPRWRLVDFDADLLRLAAARTPGAETVLADLGDLDAAPLDGATLVTASALFDLVSRAWAERLADRLARRGLGLYAALSYDGEMTWSPRREGDAEAAAAFNAHQRSDKGFGPAMGPEAGPLLAQMFRERGYEASLAPSPWRLGPDQAELQDALNDGIAAVAEAPAWGQARRAASASAWVTVGHWDLLATPGAPRAQS
jgi:SAM-dependent methyltransferase